MRTGKAGPGNLEEERVASRYFKFFKSVLALVQITLAKRGPPPPPNAAVFPCIYAIGVLFSRTVPAILARTSMQTLSLAELREDAWSPKTTYIIYVEWAILPLYDSELSKMSVS